MPHYGPIEDPKLTASFKTNSTDCNALNDNTLRLDFPETDYLLISLLDEYIDTMDASDCYVCVQLPASVAEGVTSHSLPLTY